MSATPVQKDIVMLAADYLVERKVTNVTAEMAIDGFALWAANKLSGTVPTPAASMLARIAQIGRDWRDADSHMKADACDYLVSALQEPCPDCAPTTPACSTCNDTGEVDMTLGGYSFSDPRARCPDCASDNS